ncbi:venom protease [Tetranychus urticae]|uniref:Peptidase S1 domain-containing protein n=1 Tax=Tetranychus urticae TaxID=32264 RepID=T1K1Z0_TETUR|nr:venom protease [Tetranychus urticae]
MLFTILIVIYSISSINCERCDCGYSESYVGSRIYGGSAVTSYEYPWMAHLRFFEKPGGDRFGLCGGFLVDSKHVVTAAHCIHDGNQKLRSIEATEVYLGVRDLTNLNTAHKVAKFFYPTTYKRRNLLNDIAVLELAEPVNFTRTVSPICLPKSDDEPYKVLQVAGFGRLGANSNPSKVLMHVQVEYIKDNKCNQMIKDYFMRTNPNIAQSPKDYDVPKVHETHMCCVDTKTGGDACRGDSGGALMYKSGGRYFAVGLVSGAFDECDDPRTPGFYTIVRKFRGLISRTAKNAQFCNY